MKTPTREEIMNLWLSKYHNTTVDEVIAKHPQEVLSNSDWFKLYPCTQEQHDEWEKECKTLLNKKYKISKTMIKYGWWSIALDCSPYVPK